MSHFCYYCQYKAPREVFARTYIDAIKMHVLACRDCVPLKFNKKCRLCSATCGKFTYCGICFKRAKQLLRRTAGESDDDFNTQLRQVEHCYKCTSHLLSFKSQDENYFDVMEPFNMRQYCRLVPKAGDLCPSHQN